MADEQTTAAPVPWHLDAEAVTAYTRGGFGYRRIELRVLNVRIAKYVQHEAAVWVEWIERGKRKRMGTTFTDRDGVGLVVLEGYGHPELRDWLEDTTTAADVANGVTVGRSRWTCFAPEWSADFDRAFEAYAPGKTVLADYRRHDVSGGRRLAELQKGAELTAGDRVWTHRGTGRIMLVGRGDANEVERFRVLLDHVAESGSAALEWIRAKDCQWEGVKA